MIDNKNVGLVFFDKVLVVAFEYDTGCIAKTIDPNPDKKISDVQ